MGLSLDLSLQSQVLIIFQNGAVRKEYVTWDLDMPFSVTINYALDMAFEEAGMLRMRAGIYHGDEIMCAAKSTKPGIVEAGTIHIDEGSC